MTQPLLQLPWQHPDWHDQVTTWVHVQLAANGRAATGPLEMIHQRPWSAFAQIATDQGTVYFKAPAPHYSYEALLTEALVVWQPACTVALLAIDRANGWMLSADSGITLRRDGQTVAQVSHWLNILPIYSELQIALIDKVDDAIGFNMPDRRLARLPEAYAQLLASTDDLLIDQEQGLTTAEYQRLRAGQARFAEQCAELAAFGLPETVTHEEIHENNVLIGNGRYVFTDWSDCSVAHPFFSMLVTLRAAAHWLKLDEGGAELQQMRAAYLEPWSQFASHDALGQALALAYRLSMVNRALSWHDALNRLPPADKQAYADSVPGWLQDYLQAEAALDI